MTNTNFRIIFILFLAAIAPRVSRLHAVESGVYLLKESESDTGIHFPGGYRADLGRKLERSEYELEVVSASNLNDAFEIEFKSKMGDRPGVVYVAIAVDGKVIEEIGGNHCFKHCDQEIAAKIAAMVGRTPYLRKDVGKFLLVTFVPQKKVIRGSEPINFAVQVKNVGTEPLFIEGELPSKDRSASMDIVLDEGSFAACKDVRSKTGKVSIGEPRSELKPGETKELRQEDIRRWFVPTRTGWPFFKIIYQLPIYEDVTAEYPLWNGLFAGELSFEYQMAR